MQTQIPSSHRDPPKAGLGLPPPRPASPLFTRRGETATDLIGPMVRCSARFAVDRFLWYTYNGGSEVSLVRGQGVHIRTVGKLTAGRACRLFYSCCLRGGVFVPGPSLSSVLLFPDLFVFDGLGGLASELPGFQQLAHAFSRVKAVKALTSRRLHFHVQTGGSVSEIHAGGGSVDLLSAGALRGDKRFVKVSFAKPAGGHAISQRDGLAVTDTEIDRHDTYYLIVRIVPSTTQPVFIADFDPKCTRHPERLVEPTAGRSCSDLTVNHWVRGELFGRLPLLK